jgi:hypothetical protein
MLQYNRLLSTFICLTLVLLLNLGVALFVLLKDFRPEI